MQPLLRKSMVYFLSSLFILSSCATSLAASQTPPTQAAALPNNTSNQEHDNDLLKKLVAESLRSINPELENLADVVVQYIETVAETFPNHRYLRAERGFYHNGNYIHRDQGYLPLR